MLLGVCTRMRVHVLDVCVCMRARVCARVLVCVCIVLCMSCSSSVGCCCCCCYCCCAAAAVVVVVVAMLVLSLLRDVVKEQWEYRRETVSNNGRPATTHPSAMPVAAVALPLALIIVRLRMLAL